MIFNLMKLIYILIILFFKILYFIIFNAIKYIYYFSIFAYKTIRYLLKNDNLRFPTLLIAYWVLTSTNIIIISSVLYLFIIHRLAVMNNIYTKIYLFYINFVTKLNSLRIISKKLKDISCERKILNNFSLEFEDKTIYLHHLVITNKGVYNIIPFEEYNSLHSYKILENIDKLKEFIKETFPNNPSLFNLIAYKNNNQQVLVTDYPFKLLSIDNLPNYIEDNPYKKIAYSIDEIYFSFKENKLWLLDDVVSNFMEFAMCNTKLVLFTFLCPLIYIVYIFSFLFIANTLNNITIDGINKITEVFNSLH